MTGDVFRFVEVMGSFCEDARRQCDILQAMFKKMETLYGGLESYYVFDKQKYTLEEFMSDVKTFKDQFKVRSFLCGFFFRQTSTMPFFSGCLHEDYQRKGSPGQASPGEGSQRKART